MDAFEEIITGLFRQEKYWTWQSYKVMLTKADKQEIERPSLPRPEIDILAYKPRDNELLWIECKSYLDSFGVTINASGIIQDASNPKVDGFKVFNDERYRRVVSTRLIQQVVDDGLTLPNPTLCFVLVAGRVHKQSARIQLHELFERNGWRFHDALWIKERLRLLATRPYENDVAIMVAKLFERID